MVEHFLYKIQKQAYKRKFAKKNFIGEPTTSTFKKCTQKQHSWLYYQLFASMTLSEMV